MQRHLLDRELERHPVSRVRRGSSASGPVSLPLRAIPPAAILFKSSTTPKESDVDLRWDERFEYVLSEAEYDEDKQMERGLPPKAVVIQIILKMKGLLRQEVLGVVNVPLDDVIQSRHIERQYHVLGGLSSTTVSAVLNWQSF